MKKRFVTFFSNRFVQGGFIVTFSNFAIGFLNYLFSVLAGRALGPAGYGEITTLFSYLIVVTIPMGILGTLLIQKMGHADEVETYTSEIHEWLIAKIKKWWWVLVVFLAITPFVPTLTNLSPVAGYALPIMIVLVVLSVFYTTALQGLHLFLWAGILGMLGAIIKLGGAGAAIVGIAKLEGVMIALIASAVLQLVLSRVIVLRNLSHVSPVTKLLTKRLRDIFKDRQLWYTALASGVLVLLSNVDMMVVKRLFSAEDAGLYGAWSLFAKIFLYVVGPVLGLTYIYFADKKQEKYHHTVVFVSLLILLVAGIVFNYAYGWHGRLIIETLFGTKFAHILPFIEWAGYYGTTYVFLTFFMQYYLAKKQAISMIPGFLFPAYAVALLFIPKSIADVMQINMIYTLTCVCVFLLYFGNERLNYLKSLFFEA